MIDEYLKYLTASGQSKQTIALRRAHLQRAERKLGDLTKASGQELIQYMSAPNWSREYRRSTRSTLRGFYTWLQLRGQRADNPALELPRIKPAAAKPRPTPDIAYKKALKDAEPREVLMLLLGAEAGLRRGEVAQIHRKDLLEDLGGYSLLVHGKGNKERIVPLKDSLAKEVIRMLKDSPNGFLFPGQIGGHLSPAYVGKKISRLMPAGVTMHSLRHRFATRAYAASSDLLAVQELLGHASPETTRIYVKIDRERLRKVADAA